MALVQTDCHLQHPHERWYKSKSNSQYNSRYVDRANDVNCVVVTRVSHVIKKKCLAPVYPWSLKRKNQEILRYQYFVPPHKFLFLCKISQWLLDGFPWNLVKPIILLSGRHDCYSSSGKTFNLWITDHTPAKKDNYISIRVGVHGIKIEDEPFHPELILQAVSV